MLKHSKRGQLFLILRAVQEEGFSKQNLFIITINTKMNKSKEKEKVHKVMKEYKEGKLHSGSKKGKIVKKRKQAVAIALSEARKEKRGGYKKK